MAVESRDDGRTPRTCKPMEGLRLNQAGNKVLWVGGGGSAKAYRTCYRRNRYLDPATGRFTREDPIGLAGGMNLYGFANGDPVNLAAPFGLGPCDNLLPEVCKDRCGRVLPVFWPTSHPV
ncbi:MAG: RHS repeat-associated core domain-containing protein [Tepidiformaceae bacterium]